MLHLPLVFYHVSSVLPILVSLLPDVVARFVASLTSVFHFPEAISQDLKSKVFTHFVGNIWK